MWPNVCFYAAHQLNQPLSIYGFSFFCVLVSDNVTSVNRYMYAYEIKMHITHFIAISVRIRVSLWCVCVFVNGAGICMSIMFENMFHLVISLWKYLYAVFCAFNILIAFECYHCNSLGLFDA